MHRLALMMTAVGGLALGTLASGQVIVGPITIPFDGHNIGNPLQWKARGHLMGFSTATTVAAASKGASEHTETWMQISDSLLPTDGRAIQLKTLDKGYQDQIGSEKYIVPTDQQATLLNRGYIPQRASKRVVKTYTSSKDLSQAGKDARLAGLNEMKVLKDGEQLFEVQRSSTSIGYVKEMPASGDDSTLHWFFKGDECSAGDGQAYACLHQGKRYSLKKLESALGDTKPIEGYTYVHAAVNPTYIRLTPTGQSGKGLEWANGKLGFGALTGDNSAWRTKRTNDDDASELAIYHGADGKKVLTRNGSGVTLSDYVAGDKNQRWAFSQVAGGRYHVISKTDDKMSLHESGGVLTLTATASADVWTLSLK